MTHGPRTDMPTGRASACFRATVPYVARDDSRIEDIDCDRSNIAQALSGAKRDAIRVVEIATARSRESRRHGMQR